MVTENVELSGVVKRVTTNTVSVKKCARGLQITVEAPEIHQWIVQLCGACRPYINSPRAGWPREGLVATPTANPTTGYAEVTLPPALVKYNSDCLYIDGESYINLAILRHEKAATGPVSYTFPGVFSPEEVKKILQAAQQTILSLYQDHMREYGGTSTIKIVR